jgi:hypothetical protein
LPDRGFAREGFTSQQGSPVEIARNLGPPETPRQSQVFRGDLMKFVVTIIQPFQIDGKHFVLDLQGAVRIRAGEVDTAAI